MWVAVWRALAQKRGGSEAWIRRVRRTSFVVRSIRSALPFCGEVYGQDMHSCTPRERKKEREVWLSNSRAVVTLDGLNDEAELSGHPGEEVEEGGERLRLGTLGKSPRVVREVVNHHEIVLVTRHAGYRSGPQITVNQIKHMRRM